MATSATNQITIIDLTDGYSVVLTNENHTFLGGTSSVTSQQSATTTIAVYQGADQLACNSTLAQGKFTIGTITGTSTNLTATTTQSTTDSTTPSITITAKSGLNAAGTLTIPIIIHTSSSADDDITFNKTFSYSIAYTGQTGSTGKGISSTTISYARGVSGTTVPSGDAGTSDWSSSVPAQSDSYPFLWTRTYITYTSGSPTTSYSVSYKGTDGITLTSSTVAYARCKSGTDITTSGNIDTSVGTSGWSDSPIETTSTYLYLWTRTSNVYSDTSKNTVSYSVSKKGDTGQTGAAGADAITISITTNNGTVLKNNSGSTVLTANVYKGATACAVSAAGVVTSGSTTLGTLKWYTETSTTAVATAATYTVSASAVDSSLNVTCKLEN